MPSATVTVPKTITIELQPQARQSLQRISEVSGRSHSAFMNSIFNDFLQQAINEIQGVNEALEQVNNGEVVEGERVHKWMQSLCTKNPLPMPTPRK